MKPSREGKASFSLDPRFSGEAVKCFWKHRACPSEGGVGQWGLRENFLGEGVGESIFSLINMAQERKHSFSSAGCYCVDRECLNCDAYLVGVCERTN